MKASPTTKWEIRSQELSSEITEKHKIKSALEEKVRSLESSRRSIESEMNKNVDIYNGWIVDSANKLIAEKEELVGLKEKKEVLEQTIKELSTEADRLEGLTLLVRDREKELKNIEKCIEKFLKEQTKEEKKTETQKEKLVHAKDLLSKARQEEGEWLERQNKMKLNIKKLDAIHSRRNKVLIRQEIKVKEVLRKYNKK